MHHSSLFHLFLFFLFTVTRFARFSLLVWKFQLCHAKLKTAVDYMPGHTNCPGRFDQGFAFSPVLSGGRIRCCLKFVCFCFGSGFVTTAREDPWRLGLLVHLSNASQSSDAFSLHYKANPQRGLIFQAAAMRPESSLTPFGEFGAQ
ncbi:hypothetical protein B0T09DRAFT_181637 [Sordaria sp. MPI-SDFR-AT-0083]|nr:hypothetical protein B0T09DRAFT_181637 [Sordaria sp. MPI-SDFR-AT-0083]